MMKLSMFYGLIPFFASALLALALALGYKAMHKQARRRSPLDNRKIGKIPGQGLVDRASHHDTELLTAVMLMYMAFPLMFMMWVGFHFRLNAIEWGVIETMCLIGALGMFGYGFFDYVRNHRAREKVRDGLLAERVTGMQLNRLAVHDCIVLHDLPCEGFNIDHVVIAPRGVYAVETKSFRKPKDASDDRKHPSNRVTYDGKGLAFPDFATRDPVEQATRQAQWLGRQLRESLQRNILVIPAVALPGWYVDQPDEVWRSAPVKVFTPMGEGANFMTKALDNIDPDVRRLIKETLAARYPLVAE